MNPNRGEQGNFELPPQPAAPETDQGQEQAIEAPPARQEQAGKQAPLAPALPAVAQDIPAADQPVIAALAKDVAAPPADSDAGASDSDRIETEWIDKVKSVVATTQDDPYQQKHKMSEVKAQYIQKRFNKTIKTDDAGA